jgi:ABC-type transport system involved in cytochrome bd biosynthesis fused ATPase/permease subunit
VSEGRYLQPTEPSMAEPEREILRCIYEQNWQQLRHVENERLGFAAIYCAVVSGVLSFLASWDDVGSLTVSVALSTFLVLFTVLALLLSLRLGSGAHHHQKKLVRTLEQMDASEWQEIGAPGTKDPDWTRPFRLGVVFPAFYGLAFLTVLSVLIAILV